MELRIGHGIDVHQLVEGRKLVLGGVEIPYHKGLLGHSDADVVIHALIDAILGAAAKPDIGQVFPNTDARYRNANSLDLLLSAWQLVAADGWKINNFDLSIAAEAPKLNPYVPQMRNIICQKLAVPLDRCGIKAGTFEKLSFIGRGEGILASSVVLLMR